MTRATATSERHVMHVVNLIDATRDRAEVERLRQIAADMLKETAEQAKNAIYETMLDNLRQTMGGR